MKSFKKKKLMTLNSVFFILICKYDIITVKHSVNKHMYSLCRKKEMSLEICAVCITVCASCPGSGWRHALVLL